MRRTAGSRRPGDSTREHRTPMARSSSSDAGEPGFEERLARLESVLTRLERGDLPLDEALSAYEAGIAELRECTRLLDAADARIQQLRQAWDGSPGITDVDAAGET
jgi:exodeoxyribonuclease VII small subunit